MSGKFVKLKIQHRAPLRSRRFQQSQPCHWRNIKSVTKRDVSNQTTSITNEIIDSDINATAEKREKQISDNISLFQSLRVLQEGEGEDSLGDEVRSKYWGRVELSNSDVDAMNLLPQE